MKILSYYTEILFYLYGYCLFPTNVIKKFGVRADILIAKVKMLF